MGLGFGRRAAPAQKARVIQELRPEIPLKMLLSVAHLSRSTFYDEIKRMKKGDKYASVKIEIQAICIKNMDFNFGSPAISLDPFPDPPSDPLAAGRAQIYWPK